MKNIFFIKAILTMALFWEYSNICKANGDDAAKVAKDTPARALHTKPVSAQSPTNAPGKLQEQAVPKQPQNEPLPKHDVAEESPKKTPTAPQKPSFSFREFFGFGGKDKQVEVEFGRPAIKKQGDIKIEDLKLQKISATDLKNVSLIKTEQLYKTIQKKTDMTHKDIEWVTAHSNAILEMSPESFKNFTPEEQSKMHIILKMRALLITYANNRMLKIDEQQKSIKATGGSPEKTTEELESVCKLYFVEQPNEAKTMEGVASAIDAMREKVEFGMANLELLASTRKLETAKQSQLKKDGSSFCETFVRAYNPNDLGQQAEISKNSIAILKRVAPIFLKEQNALIKTLTTQIKKLKSKNPNDPKINDLTKKLNSTHNAVRIINTTLDNYSGKKELAAKKARVKELAKTKEKDFVKDKFRYNELMRLETSSEAYSSDKEVRKQLLQIRLEKKALEDKYGNAPTEFKSLKEAIQFNK
jgi:hypothetical protein